MSEEQSHRQYVQEQVAPIFKDMVNHMLQMKPGDPPSFVVDYLLEKTGQKNALVESEKIMLGKLRQEVARLKSQLQPQQQEANDAQSDESEDDEHDTVEDLPVIVPKKAAGPRISVSAEAYGAFNKKEDFVARDFPKTEEQTTRIVDKISQAFMFQALEEKDLKIVIGAMEERKVSVGDYVITQGDDGAELFVVDTGKLECTKLFPGNSEPTKLKEYFPGEAFGELSLLYNAPRAANIIAMEESVLWVLDRGTFNHIVKDSAVKKRESYEQFMANNVLFAELDAYERSNIADAFKSISFPADTYVVKEGDWGDIFYMVVEGTAVATKSLEIAQPPTQVKEYKAGDYFGELALLKGEPRAANVISTSQLKCATLDRKSFKRMLGPLEDILKRNAEVYSQFVKK